MLVDGPSYQQVVIITKYVGKVYEKTMLIEMYVISVQFMCCVREEVGRSEGRKVWEERERETEDNESLIIERCGKEEVVVIVFFVLDQQRMRINL